MRRCSRIAGVLLCLLFPLAAVEARAGLETFGYQVPMPPTPPSVADAIATVPARSATVIAVMACGYEFDFIDNLRKKDNGEGIAEQVLGKLAYVQASPRFVTGVAVVTQPCEFRTAVGHWEGCKLFDDNCRSGDDATRLAAEEAFRTGPVWTALTTPTGTTFAPDVKPLRDKMLSFLPPECADTNGIERYSITASPPPLRLTFKIAVPCLAAQANAALLQMSRGERQVGTDKAPCHIFGSTTGDWDATLKNLIRIAELDRRSPALSPAVRKHLNDDLIDIDGGPAQESYHLWECGNEEKSVGDPQTRSDDRDGFDSFMDDLGDTLVDLAWLLLLIVLVIIAVLVAAVILAGGAVAAASATVAVAVAAAAVAAALITIPETENHLWMINSTKYLNNQYIMANGGTGYSSDQSDLRKWILDEMQKVLKKDFTEYNSRPYQRYSLVAIMNLADFAEDVDVRSGAQLVLEYAIAKYSVASNEGRRLAPYRRKREYLPHVDGIPRDGTALTTTSPPANGLFDLSGGADYLHALGLLYYGVSLNLLEFDGNPYAATKSYASQAIYGATSSYRPDATTFSLALERGNAPSVHQRLHHHGWEIASSGASFTITAGGLTTGMAKNTTIDAIDQLFVPDDLGAAIPTVVMFAGRPHLAATFTHPEVTRPIEERRSTMDRFLRFEGKRPPPVESAPSYDHNLCVWDGFACGVNVVVPSDLKAPCMKPGPRSHWFFVRSDDPDCPAYKDGPRFWMVLYNEPRLGSSVDDFGPTYSIGFVEIVDGDEMTFADFTARVAQRNPGPGAPMNTSGDCSGAYVSARGATGQRIEFDCERVTKVDATTQPKPSDWDHAGAPPGALGYAPLQSSGNGKVEITSRIAKRKLTLDFAQWDNPQMLLTPLP